MMATQELNFSHALQLWDNLCISGLMCDYPKGMQGAISECRAIAEEMLNKIKVFDFTNPKTQPYS